MSSNGGQMRDTVVMPRRLPRDPGPDDWAAQRINYEREKQGWSQEELARRVADAGVPMRQQTIQQIENGKPPRKVSLGEAVALARVFGLSVTDLTEPPDEVLTEQLAAFVADFEALESDTRDLVVKSLKLAHQLNRAVLSATEMLSYTQWRGMRPPTEELRERLETAAALLLQVRDHLAAMQADADGTA